MKHYRVKYIALVLLLLAGPLCAVSQDRTKTKNNKAEIYDNLYDIYQEASRNRSTEACIHLSDSMRILAEKQGDKRAIVLSWANPLVYYLNTNQEEPFFTTSRIIQDAAEEVGLWSFYYYAISQESVYYLRRNKVGEALRLAQTTMEKAYADNNANGIYNSHTMMCNCFVRLGLFERALEEARLALEAEDGLPDQNFGNAALKIGEIYYKLRDWKKMIETADKYIDRMETPSGIVRMGEYRVIANYMLGDMEGYHRAWDALEVLKDEKGEPVQRGLSYVFDGIRAMDEGRWDDAKQSFDKLGNPDLHYYLMELYKRKGDTAMMQKEHEMMMEYKQTQLTTLYDADIKKYELELENHNLEQQRIDDIRRMRTVGLIALLSLLLVTGIILFVITRHHYHRQRAANALLTQQKRQLEESLAAIRKANSENEAKTAFLNSMSHDIRTPMNAIIGYSTMAQKNIDDRDKALDFLAKINAAGNNLLGLINQVLDMSRIESGAIVLNEEPTDLIDKTREMTEIIAHSAQAKNIRVDTHIYPLEHRRVYADTARMNQLILNILGNAVKYTPEGGTITYTVDELLCDKPGCGTFVFTTQDTGIGMSREYLEKIFEPFSRETTSTVSRIQGTGLGMAIVKRLVDLMGGTIDVQSEQGRGTKITVTITFRLAEEAVADTAEQPAVQTSVFTGKHALLVEDNEMNREIATMILQEHGIIVDTAEDGDIAVEKIKTLADTGDLHRYDFILMDVQMPRMDGYEATSRIRDILRPTDVHIPILALSANAFDEDRQKSLTAGMDGHIAKPIDVTELWETLARFVS